MKTRFPVRLSAFLLAGWLLIPTVGQGQDVIGDDGASLAAQQVTGPRIGIDYAEEAVEWPLRFAVSQNRHVSKPYPWRGQP